MVTIEDRELGILTEDGMFAFRYPSAEKLSEALLILALQGTRKVEDVDDFRFNPARYPSLSGRRATGRASR